MDTTRTTTSASSDEDTPGRLQRARHGRILGGVAAGLSDYLGIDVAVIRIGFVVLGLLGGIAVPLYVAGWLLIPEEGRESTIADELMEHAHLG